MVSNDNVRQMGASASQEIHILERSVCWNKGLGVCTHAGAGDVVAAWLGNKAWHRQMSCVDMTGIGMTHEL